MRGLIMHKVCINGLSEAVDPCRLSFQLLATRRYMLDNELTISEFVPGAVSRPSLQNAEMPYFTNPPAVSYENGTAVFSAEKEKPASLGRKNFDYPKKRLEFY